MTKNNANANTDANNTTGPKAPLTRRAFYARLRAAGYSKGMQLTRTGVTYSKGTGRNMATVTIPKSHTGTAMIYGDLPLTGTFVDVTSTGGRIGSPVNPAQLGLPCFLWFALGLALGQIGTR